MNFCVADANARSPLVTDSEWFSFTHSRQHSSSQLHMTESWQSAWITVESLHHTCLKKIYTVTKLAAVRVSGPSLESFTTDMCAQKPPFCFHLRLQSTVPTFAHMGEIWLKVDRGRMVYWLQASRERAKRDIKATQGADSSGFDGWDGCLPWKWRTRCGISVKVGGRRCEYHRRSASDTG